jgi:hypothetical protein
MVDTRRGELDHIEQAGQVPNDGRSRPWLKQGDGPDNPSVPMAPLPVEHGIVPIEELTKVPKPSTPNKG